MLQTESEWNITTLSETVQVDSFACGETEMDDWFHNQALRFHKGNMATVHVCLDQGDNVLGFFTLNSYYLQRRTLPKSSASDMAGGNIPVTLLGRLGVCCSHQDCGLGKWLVGQAKQLSSGLSTVCAARFLYVQAKSDTLIDWYKEQGFKSLPSNPRKMLFDLHPPGEND